MSGCWVRYKDSECVSGGSSTSNSFLPHASGQKEGGRCRLFYWCTCNNVWKSRDKGEEEGLRTVDCFVEMLHSDWLKRARLWIGVLRSSIFILVYYDTIACLLLQNAYSLSLPRCLPNSLICESYCPCACNLGPRADHVLPRYKSTEHMCDVSALATISEDKSRFKVLKSSWL